MNKKNKKRGAVIELVLFVMTVIFVLCALLTTMSTIAFKHKKSTLDKITQRAQIQTVAEIALADMGEDGVLNKTQTAIGQNEYLFSFNGEQNGTGVLTVSHSGKVVLTVSLKKFIIVDWQY